MTMESSVLPMPSEAIIPPAAYLAWFEGTKIFQFSFRRLVGGNRPRHGRRARLVARRDDYVLAGAGRRPAARRALRPVRFVSAGETGKGRTLVSHYGSMGVFVARLLPGARQLVGIPAGIARMDYRLFSLFTLLGAAIWCSVLCYVGVKAGRTNSSCTARCVT